MATVELDTTKEELEHNLCDARARTLELVADLADDQLMGPRLAIINPFLWEIGHVAWFQARWVLERLRGLSHSREDADSLYDSMEVAHDTRWDLPLPTRRETLDYMQTELERARTALHANPLDPDVVYFYRLVTYHEDMHCEAFTYTRQTLDYPAPTFLEQAASAGPGGDADDGAGNNSGRRFVDVPGGRFELGGARSESFVFDNEKWAHRVELRPFRMAVHAVTNGQFAEFVDDGGYENHALWDDEGWAWRTEREARHPVYWRRAGDGWEQRVFDRWQPLTRRAAIIHVNWYEASAYCRWSGTRLPSEAEWEAAAACDVDGGALHKERCYPWGDEPPDPRRANLDGRHGVIDVDLLPAGDNAFGCRQMFGNVWEWTSTPFGPFPGFVPDPYKDYSYPWMDGRHMVLRGGCWTTRSRLLRNTWRNFYTRDRRDVFAGFRVCAAD